MKRYGEQKILAETSAEKLAKSVAMLCFGTALCISVAFVELCLHEISDAAY